MKTKIHLILLVLTVGVRSVWSQDSWTSKTAFAGGVRYGAVGICIGDKCYAGLGNDDAGNHYNDFWEFDAINNTWTRKADFPGGARTTAAGFAIGNKGYIGTGSYTPGDINWTWYNDLWEYDPASDTWTQKASFGERGRGLAVGFSIGGKGYMGTGTYRFNRFVDAVYLDDFWEYDPATDHWTQKKSIPTEGRTGAIGMAIGDKAYVGLGFFYYDTRKDDLWEYDPTTDAWTQKASFGGGPCVNASAFSINDRGYVGNGFNYGYLTEFWEYFPGADLWTKKTDFPGVVRESATTFSTATKGYIFTGGNNTGSLNDVWEYTPCGDPVLFSPQQLFCYSPTNRYGVIPLVVYDPCGTPQVSYTISGPTTRSGTGIDASGFFNPGINKITWRVISATGKVVTLETTIVVQAKMTVRIPDSYAVQRGGMPNTLYVGYGPSSLTLTAKVTGGEPYAGNTFLYTWSTGEHTKSITVNPTVAGTYSYSVVVRDMIGCEKTDSLSVRVVDVRCGSRLQKIEVCLDSHRRHGKSVCVDGHAVASLLRHGAMLDNCSCRVDGEEHHADAIAARDEDEEDIYVYPNPSGGSFVLQWINWGATPVRIQIVDRYGNEALSQQVNTLDDVQRVPIEMPASANGVYVIKIVSDTGIKTKKIIIQK
ncbi:T9SS type A sorting domain-containing protein [Chryseolinea lacunae]|uniref:T9SS type A sorting domain-containing protein n=1 Tax=Chryseolinea lacunae TaxID=2801331 RepID=A0ABS1KNW8_9BACT|nr:T9SS type A sorting domain-containing protein [Chryseolinea lacunae]MBL0741023.1 T9SS type A sorting domain-containing protein [Chryseolinea lacunae]